MAFLAGAFGYYFLTVDVLPKSPNQSSSNPWDFFSSFFSYLFFGSLSYKLKSLKKLFYHKKLLEIRIFSLFGVLIHIDFDFFTLFERKVNLIAKFLFQRIGVQAPKIFSKKLQFIALIVLLKDNSKIKRIISVPKSDTDPQEPSSGFFQSNCIPPGTVLGFHNCLLIVWGYFSFGEDFIGLVDEGDLDDFVLLGNFDATLPEHLFPVVQVVAFGLGQGGHFEDGHALFFVAVG